MKITLLMLTLLALAAAFTLARPARRGSTAAAVQPPAVPVKAPAGAQTKQSSRSRTTGSNASLSRRSSVTDC